MLLATWHVALPLPIAVSARAQSGAGAVEPQVEFDIPAQPLAQALSRYYDVTHVPLLYDSAETRSRMSTSVRGRYTPRAALTRLLSGTGLTVRYTRDNAVMIVPVAIAAEAAIPLGRVVVRERAPAQASRIEFLAYYDELRSAIEELLQTDPRTRRLRFSVVVSLTVAETGRLTGIAWDRRSGRAATDAALLEVLGDAMVAPPPNGAGRRLKFRLTGQSSKEAH